MVREYIDGTPVMELMAKYGYKTKKSISDKVKKYYKIGAKQSSRLYVFIRKNNFSI